MNVSVVITCFNYERYVGLAIDSALAQSHAPFEIIVVDDGSTDRSPVVLASFGDRIRVITQANGGHVVAFNAGYLASSGDAVLFLDADDLLHRDAIARSVAAWMPTCAKVQFELEIIDAKGERLGRRFCNYVTPYGAEQIRAEFGRFGTYAWPVLTGNVYARTYLERVMPLTVTIAPDGVLNTLAPLYGDIAVVPETLGYYRLHDSNQSYHAVATRAIGDRFAKQVRIRGNEMNLLAEHAARRGVTLPPGRLLDNDLPSINYRLMLRKMRVPYANDAEDSVPNLWRAGLRLLKLRRLPFRLTGVHVVWLSILSISPKWIATKLIALRFARAELLRPFRRILVALRLVSRKQTFIVSNDHTVD